MTVLGTDSRVSFNCSGATIYPLGSGFLFFDAADLVVVRVDSLGVETTLALTTDYTVSGGDGATGSVTTVATYTDGQLVIYRELEAKQTYDALIGDGFNTDSFENTLDRVVMLIQQVLRKITGAMRLGDSDTSGADLELPAPEANKGWKMSADGLSVVNTTYDPDEGATNAAASAAAALVSENNSAQSELDSEDSNLESGSWANEAEDVPVKEYTAGVGSDRVPTVYSAKHHALKAGASAASAATTFDSKFAGFLSTKVHDVYTGDIDTIDHNSIYNVPDSTIITRPPGFGWFFVHTMLHTYSPAWRVQMAYNMTGTSEQNVYTRVSNDLGVWSTWTQLGGGATGGAGNNAFFENDTNITVDYTITTGKNAMSAGPITVDAGVTVTVPTGSVWTVV